MIIISPPDSSPILVNDGDTFESFTDAIDKMLCLAFKAEMTEWLPTRLQRHYAQAGPWADILREGN